MKNLLELTYSEAERWVWSLPRGDEARKTEMRQFIAATAFYAGAQAQLRRLFPHLDQDLDQANGVVAGDQGDV